MTEVFYEEEFEDGDSPDSWESSLTDQWETVVSKDTELGAGIYMLVGSCQFQASQSNKRIGLRVILNDTNEINIEWIKEPNPDNVSTWTCFRKHSLPEETHNIKLQVWCDSGGGAQQILTVRRVRARVQKD